TLATEVGCTAKAVLISSSVQPGPAGLLSAWSSTWAWVRVRAAIFPLRTSASNCSRSSGLKVTTYFFMLGVLRGLVTAMFPKNTQRLLTLKITPDEVLGPRVAEAAREPQPVAVNTGSLWSTIFSLP